MLEGHVHPDFWSVARQLRRVIPRNGRGGAAVCIYHRGECVADLWGGSRDVAGSLWTSDTLALCYSTTKGVLATLVHSLVDRGALAYDDPVAKYWPAFARRGKSGITLRQLLCHEAGLFRIAPLIEHARQMFDWDHMISVLEDAEPAHTPGAAHGYHGLTYGWLVGELLQRATGAGLRELLDRQLVGPLALDGLFIGLPASAESRRADLVQGQLAVDPQGRSRVRRRTRLIGRGLRAAGVPIDLAELEAALMPVGIEDLDFNSPEMSRAIVPAVNGMFTARSLARVYAALAGGGVLDGVRLLSERTLAEATRVHNQGLGRVVPFPMNWRLGYHRIPTVRVKAPLAFGHFGIGGSGAFADPDRDLSVALVLNSGMGTPFGDTRILRITSAALQSADARHEPSAAMEPAGETIETAWNDHAAHPRSRIVDEL
jgi:CubicO group peptidase (beta-lactamase class C family)